jgi:putative MATE family efflux protein
VQNAPALRKTFVIFFAPMILSNILQSMFGTINSAYLGQMIGVEALAASSVFFPMMFFFVSFVMGLASGATVLIGQAWGSSQPDKVRAVAGTAFTVALMLAALIALGGALFARPLVVALATPPGIVDEAASYARVMMITMPLTFAFILTTSMLRGVGDTVTPLIALAISTSLGLVVTPALIRGWYGLPQLGVASAAWASACSSVVTLAWLHIRLARRKHPLAMNSEFLRAMGLDVPLLKTILRLGIPAALGMVVMSVAELILLGLVNGFGAEATAAYGVVNQVFSYTQFPALSIAIAVSILGAQAIGRGQSVQIGRIVRTGLEMNVVLTGSLVALGYLFSRPLTSLFITDAAVLDMSQRLLHIVLWSSVLFGMSTVFSGAMRASGTVWLPLLISSFAIVAIKVPLAIVLSRHLGIDGVWIAYPATFAAMFVLQMSYYMLVWRKREIRRLI